MAKGYRIKKWGFPRIVCPCSLYKERTDDTKIVEGVLTGISEQVPPGYSPSERTLTLDLLLLDEGRDDGPLAEREDQNVDDHCDVCAQLILRQELE